MRSPMPANSTVWSPTMSPPRMVAKPIDDGSRSPVTPSRAKTAHFLQVAAERAGHDFAHLQRGAGRRVDLVAVMRLDDLDVVAFRETLRGHLQQLHRHVDAHAHVGREHDRGVARQRRAMAALPASSKPVVPMIILMPCSAQYSRCSSVPSGRVKSIRKSASAKRLVQASADRHAGQLAEESGGVGAEAGRAGDVERAGQRQRRARCGWLRSACGPCGPLAPATAIFI